MMTTEHKPLPTWILIVSGIFALLEIAVSVLLYLSPHAVVESLDLQANGVMYVIYMWAARQFALGVIFAYATLQKSKPMLTITYIFFFVMFVGDFFIGFLQNENSMIISGIVMCMISALLLFAINRKN